jgi:hypothetical protein
MTECDRCLGDASAYTTSQFNTQTLCMDCKKLERQHPDYQRALEAEREAIKGGDYNYPGIGKPAAL